MNILSKLFGTWQKKLTTFIALCIGLAGGWHCYDDAEKDRIMRNQNIKNIPNLENAIIRIDRRYSGDSTDRLLKAKDWKIKREQDSSNFQDSLAIHRGDLDLLFRKSKTERQLFRN